MKAILLALALTLPTLAKAQAPKGTLDYLSEKYGFRDATFEKPIASFKGMKLVQDKGIIKTYTRATDKLQVGEYLLKNIFYQFYNGQLYNVGLSTEGKKNTLGVYLAMCMNYGAPEGEKPSLAWESKRVLMTVHTAQDLTSSTYVIMSRAMASKQRQGEKAKQESALDKLVEKATNASSDL